LAVVTPVDERSRNYSQNSANGYYDSHRDRSHRDSENYRRDDRRDDKREDRRDDRRRDRDDRDPYAKPPKSGSHRNLEAEKQISTDVTNHRSRYAISPAPESHKSKSSEHHNTSLGLTKELSGLNFTIQNNENPIDKKLSAKQQNKIIKKLKKDIKKKKKLEKAKKKAKKNQRKKEKRAKKESE
jgi:chromodomain-helicase-DNA-binding protein 1